MIKFSDIVFKVDACCGDHAEVVFDNGYAADVIKSGEVYTVLCKQSGLLVSNFPIQRGIDSTGVENALNQIKDL